MPINLEEANKLRARWSEIEQQAPFHAHMPPESNGYVYVYNKDGKEIATCYSDAAAAATMIAAALNLVAAARLSAGNHALEELQP